MRELKDVNFNFDELHVLLSHISSRQTMLTDLINAARNINDMPSFAYFDKERKILNSIMNKLHQSRIK